ncbi:hypothetical protein SLS56_010837 [Neofusicoccum ribis]|uniref:Uncharacterized protein n=1 Tax=Neofusicoccum ribis TaxID=45134 RepID=A0ABR3SE33_9PEZI
MTRYYPLYVRRSDGKLETVHGKKKEKNEPTPEQLNDTPDSSGVSDFYRPIAEDEAKHLDWRRKLGGMLMRELATAGSEHQHKACMLAALPENYRLFEHIKSRAHDGDPQSRKASKNHAGGGHDRQDAYLYGHPMGRKKRYRSPADFFPHLLWLATDKDGDPNNCSCKYHTLLFRPGEVVWVSRGEAWGLGVLIRRFIKKIANNQIERHYVVQPLSHPLDFQTPVHLSNENLLRPWLAWSPPPLTFGQLQNRAGVTYDSVDWQVIASGHYGNGNPEVDASILAAKSVDNTYTPFKLLNNSRPGPSMEERRWAGIYLGAEKIWVGEPVRIQMDMAGINLPILIVVDIVERVQQGRSTITVFGDLYTFIGNIPSNTPVPSTDHLPPRMVLDLRYRNQVSGKTGRQGTWKLLRPMHGVPIEHVKGRWYESSVLLPIVLGDKDYDNTIRSGNLDDASHWLNARNDSNKATDGKAATPALGIRQPERRDALGRSVPTSTHISDSLDPPAPDELQALITPTQPSLLPNQSAAQATDPALMVDAAGFGGMPGVSDVVGDFMNLDGDFAMTGGGAAGAQGGTGNGNWGVGP